MKRIFFISISLWMMVACSSSETTSEKPENLEMQKMKDSMPAMNVNVREAVVDYTSTKTFDAFYFRSNEQVAYVKDNQISFLDLEFKTSQFFEEELSVMNLVFSEDGQTMFYTVVLPATDDKEERLGLKKAVFSEDKLIVSFIADLERDPNELITSTYMETAKIEFNGETISIECNFVWDMFTFGSSIAVDTESGAVEYYKDKNILNEDYFEESSSEIADQIENIEIDGVYDLFRIQDEDSLRITNTTAIERDEPEYPDPISFKLSPDGRRLFCTVMTGMGDLAHGPGFLINLDGSGQTILQNDALGMLYKRYAWIYDTSNLVFLKNDNTLCLYKENEIFEADENVSYFCLKPQMK